MEIKRLLYLPEAVGTLGLKYETVPGTEEQMSLYSNLSIYEAIKVHEAAYKGDICLSEDDAVCFRMGWQAAIVCEKTANQFEVKRICSIGDGGGRFTGNLNGRFFNQIMTQAVDTCTVYYIDAGDRIIFAHFKYTNIKIFRAMLDDLLENKTIQTIFCSAAVECYDDKERAAHNEIKNYVAEQQYIFLNRSGCGENKYLSHMELGFVANDAGGTTFFGDVLYRAPETLGNRYFPDVVQKNNCDCFIFEVDDINNLCRLRSEAERLFAIEQAPDSGYGGGGCCLII